MSFSHGLAKLKENEENRAKPTPIAMVAPELKQNSEDTGITKTCAVLGCEESKNLNSDSFFRFPENLSLKQIWADLTGRNNWTPTDYSYICVQHFSVDCFECDVDNTVILNNNAVPSLKLPKHVLEVEYIDEDTFDNEYDEDDEDDDMEDEIYTEDENEDHIGEHNEEDRVVTVKYLPNGTIYRNMSGQPVITVSKKTESVNKSKEEENLELLKLFSDVQKMQNQATSLKEKLKKSMKVYRRQSRYLVRLKEVIEMKKNLLNQRRKRKSRILLSLQDKIKEDTKGLVLAMPTRHTDDLKNFALSIYKYSPQSYIYIRNTLRTLLPSTDVLDTWASSGFEPKNVLTNSNLVRVVSELTDTELSCKVSLR